MSIHRKTIPPITQSRTINAGSRTLRCATFLAPNLFWLYEYVTRRLGERLGCRAQLVVGRTYAELHGVDVAFVCGLPYVESTDEGVPPVEPLAAPVLHGERYRDQPIYYSDVIVRRDSTFRTFADLRGCTWSYNEPLSQSGYGITRYHLARLGEGRGFFGRVIEGGWHERAIDMVVAGEVDASAIDAHVLAIAVRARPDLALVLRVIASLGPSTIQPVVASRHLSRTVRRQLRATLLELADDSAARAVLDRALIQRFVAVHDANYDDIRHMRAVAAAAGLSALC